MMQSFKIKVVSYILTLALLVSNFSQVNVYASGADEWNSDFGSDVDFSITGVSIGIVGDQQATREGIKIGVDYDGSGTIAEDASELDRIMTYDVEGVKIDQKKIPLYDDFNRYNFVLFAGKFTIYADTSCPDGIVAADDFKARGGNDSPHKVEIYFKNKKKLVYTDTNYVERTDIENEWFPWNKESGNDDQNPAESTASGYSIKAIEGNWDKTAYDIDIDPNIDSEGYKKIKSVNVNGKVYEIDHSKALDIENDDFRLYNGDVRINSSDAVEQYKKSDSPYVGITFADDSKLEYGKLISKLSYIVKYYKDGTEFETVTGEVEISSPSVDSVDDKCPDGYELDSESSTALPFTVTASNNTIEVKYVKKVLETEIAKDYVIEDVLLTNDTTIYVVFEEEVSYSANELMTSILVNGVELKGEDETSMCSKKNWRRSLKLQRDDLKAIFDKESPAKVKVTFTDDSVSKNYEESNTGDENTLSYTIEYYKDNVKTESVVAEVGVDSPEIVSVEDKCPEGYEIDTDNSTTLPFTVTTESNVIKVYYVKKASDNGIAKNYVIEDVLLTDDKTIYVVFEEEVSYSANDSMKSILINGVELKGEDETSMCSKKNWRRSLKLQRDDLKAVFDKESPAKVKVTFTDDSVSKNYEGEYNGGSGNGNSSGSGDDEQDSTTGKASEFKFEKAVVTKTPYGDGFDYKVFVVLDKNLPYADSEGMTVIINGDQYTGNYTYRDDKDATVVYGKEAYDSFNRTSPAKIKLVFSDGSFLTGTASAQEEPVEISYTIKYYKGDEVLEVVNGKVSEDNAVIDSVDDKCPAGYELDTDSSSTLPFTVTASNNIIEVKYVKKVLETEIAKDYVIEDVLLTNDTTIYVVFEEEVSYSANKLMTSILVNGVELKGEDETSMCSKKNWRRSLKLQRDDLKAIFDKESPAKVKVTFTDDSVSKNYEESNTGDENTLSYTIEYYKDNVKTESVVAEVSVDSPEIVSVEDKCPEGYEIDTDNSTTLPFTVTTESNVIKVYYVKKASDNGIAKDYVIEDVLLTDDATIYVVFEEEVSYSANEEMTSILVNGVELKGKDETSLCSKKAWRRSLKLNGEGLKDTFEKESPAKVKITFTDSSVCKNYEGEYNGGDGNGNENTAKIADKYTFVKAIGKDKKKTGLSAASKFAAIKLYPKWDQDDVVKEVVINGNSYQAESVPVFLDELNKDIDLIKVDSEDAYNKFKADSVSVKVVFSDDSFVEGTVEGNVEEEAELSYTIKYYKDGDVFATVEKTVKESEAEIASVEDKCPEGYELDGTNSTAFPFTVTTENNVIEVYYVKKADAPEIASEYELTRVELRKSSGKTDYVYFVFKKEVDSTKILKEVEKIVLNGVEFTEKIVEIDTSFYKNEEDGYRFHRSLILKGDEAINAYNNSASKTYKIVFTDGSEISGSEEAPADTTISNDVEDGTYTLSYKAYEDGTKKESSLGGYFDERVKLVVENGVKKVSFMNFLFAEEIIDFALENSDTFAPFEKRVLEEKKGHPVKVEYTAVIDDLSVMHKLATLLRIGGGTTNDIADYTKYRKVDLVFTEIKDDFTDYKKIEEEKLLESQNATNLETGLVGSGVDTDGDGAISKEELQNATGVSKVVYDGEDPRPNAIDLRGLNLTDISILKDLGPKVKILMLDNNKLKTLPEDVFANATGLEMILLSGNDISDLPADVFANNTKLKELTFGGNDLGELPAGLLRNNTKLKVLSFMNAGVTSVPADLIKNCSKLRELYLQSNEIKELDDSFFDGQNNSMKLGNIYLQDNQLETLPSSLGNIFALKVLDASDNKLKRVPAELGNLTLLRTLDLENNYIESMPTSIFTTMITNAKDLKTDGIRLDLSLNNLKSLPIDDMLEALKDGHRFVKLEVDRNYLKTDLSEADKTKYTSLGIDFAQSNETYFPQKQQVGASVEADRGDITLTQEFDVLEMLYWRIGDSTFNDNIAKDTFESVDEFKDYLLTFGRDINGVSRTLDRDVAIKKILKSKSQEWRVDTNITKNGGNVVSFSKGKKNEKEGLVQSFVDPSMKAGDRYTLTKTLYSWHSGEYHRVFEYSVDFVGKQDTNISNGETQEIGVKAYDHGTDNVYGMIDNYLEDTALLEKVNDKYIYKLTFDTTAFELQEFKLIGLDKEVQKVVEGNETKLTFSLDEKVDKLPCTIKAKVTLMGGDVKTKDIDLKFDYSISSPSEEVEEVNAGVYVITADKKNMSMANNSVEHSVKLTKKKSDDMFKGELAFNPMKVGEKTVAVSKLLVKVGETFVEANPVEGKSGVFTIMLPKTAFAKNGEEDTFLDIKFGLTPAIPGHADETPAVLVLDWNGDFDESDYKDDENGGSGSGSGSGNTNDDYGFVNGQKYKVRVKLVKANDDETSMGDRVLENNRDAYITRDGSSYKIVVTTNPIQVDDAKAGLQDVIAHDSAIKSISKSRTTVDGVNYISKFTMYVSEIKEEYLIGVTAGPMDDVKVRINFNLDGKVKTGSSATPNTGTVNNDSVIIDDEEKPEAVPELKRVEIEGKTSVSDGLAVLELDQDKLERAMRDAKGTGNNNFVLAVGGKADKTKVTISKKSLKKLNNGSTLQLATGSQKVTLNEEAISDLAAQKARDIDIYLKKDSKGHAQFKIMADDKVLDKVKGGLVVEIENNLQGNVVALIDKYGNQRIISKCIVDKGRATFELEGSGTVKVVENKKEFRDLAENAWYEGYVDFVSSHEIFRGISNTEFSPNTNIEKAMFLTVLHRLEKEEKAEKAKISDVPEMAYYSKAVNWAVENKIVEAKDDRLDPEKDLTREEMAVIIYNYFKGTVDKAEGYGRLDKFGDKDSISDFAKDAMNWAVKNGIFEGDGVNLNPKDLATRAEVSALLERIIRLQLR